MRAEPRYIDALPSTITTTSQNAGMYAPPAAEGPNKAHTCGTDPLARTWFQKMRPAPRRPGNISTWSVIRAPAESTSQTIGTPVRYAVSMIRMIFSTVRAPHDPALTVESLAITHTERPSTLAVPVTTPSAGRSPATTLANRPSSVNDPSSTSNPIRSRANSLPFSALASWYFGAPPASTRSRRSPRCGCPGASGAGVVAASSVTTREGSDRRKTTTRA
jgi:hypothetical protein